MKLITVCKFTFFFFFDQLNYYLASQGGLCSVELVARF